MHIKLNQYLTYKHIFYTGTTGRYCVCFEYFLNFIKIGHCTNNELKIKAWTMFLSSLLWQITSNETIGGGSHLQGYNTIIILLGAVTQKYYKVS